MGWNTKVIGTFMEILRTLRILFLFMYLLGGFELILDWAFFRGEQKSLRSRS